MTIEVKQLTINSEVSSGKAEAGPSSQPAADLDTVRQDILAECRQLVRDLLRDTRER